MDNKNQPNQEIKIVDNIAGAEYANLMQINHNKDEFMLMFANIAGGNGKVVGKIISTPGHTKKILAALTENIKKYEDQFGEIKEVVVLDKEIGFKA
ncbi:MAG: DUF3467 domain-containing protein [Patescibacteria group bacterium]